MINAMARIDRRHVILAAVLLGFAPGAASAATLITPQEAALANTEIAGTANRGYSRGPAIEQVSPAPDVTVTSPFHLVIKFVPRDEVPIDVGTATLIYGKAPLQDLTDRVGDYLTAAGIDVPAIEAPPGEHWLRVRVSDQHLRWTTTWIKVTVAGPGGDAAPTQEHTAAAVQ